MSNTSAVRLEREPARIEEPSARAEAPVGAGQTRPEAPAKRRNRLRLVLMAGGILAVAIGGGDFWLRGGRWISTDNAYVRAPKLMVSTDVSGIVSSIDVKEGQKVKAGDVLFKVDPAQFQTALDAAKANLQLTRITLEASKQDYARLQSDIEGQQAQVNLAQATFDRQTTLVQSNAGTRAAYDQAHYTLVAAQRQLDSLRQQAQAALTRLGGNANLDVETHPQYLQALAQVDEAQRQLEHTIVRAPFAGVVTAVDSLQPGTYLVSQTAALTNTGAVGLIGTKDFWVDANLKETDLTYAKAGDPAEVTIDAYPGRVWHGHVDSIAPASGSEFSVLPAQNASGNWVKVVQRVPVRVALDPDQAAPLLRAGMSAVADIDTGHQRHLSDLWSTSTAQAKGVDDHDTRKP
jgi:membrane fusion protein (multidrug efflux system)